MNQNFVIQKYIAELYQQHRHWLYVWLYQKLGSAENAEDVLHDAFSKLLRQKNILNIEHPKAFLTTVAKRVMIDRSRHTKIEQEYLKHLEHQQFCDEISPEKILMAVELLEQLAILLDKLPERSQKVFVWHYIDGEKLNVIADKLQVSSKTVHNELVKSLIHLQQRLPILQDEF
ncbi:sigma-70 family RNA polymerase sigma factor [Acinetobacter qingfengensis]|uniref:RNA polymerase subunit sigma n=1 Tax=Acinetobacter qingfengensis TaxID=1262585 RepID=A0A1E7R908_9GAMM|nr:sigma-70 family RNA polymerase sigma factor [Acinetobacter qingfengensis]KAA8735415.1 sigma-70 family RNA polymerase sigma factor [Acinetobacter qingfengensis]OEY95771.1 RNA polymerase subunit sigma [Acinetobacter qingfengensis]